MAFGPPQQGPGQPYRQPAQPASASSMAVAALILGVLSWVTMGLFMSIPGLIIAKQELGKIDRGESPEAGRTFAQIGYWTSLINVILSIFACVLFCGFYAVMFAIAGSGSAGTY